MSLHLPAPRTDETLASIAARYGRYLHVRSQGALSVALTGKRRTTAKLGTPSFLDGRPWILGERLVSADELINQHSLFRYVTAFAPAQIRDAVKVSLKTGRAGVYPRLGLTGFRIGTDRALRFCSDCLDEMELVFPDIWWQRAHQLSGVMVCHIHGTALRLSHARNSGGSRWLMQPATRQCCPDMAQSVLDPETSPAELTGLQVLAKAAAGLLWVERPAIPHAVRQANYRAELRRCGFTRNNGAIDYKRFSALLLAHWGDGLARSSSTRFLMNSVADWMAPLLASPALSHPLFHLIMEGAISATPDAPAIFGHGPWACQNPFSDHVDQPVIKAVVIKRIAGQTAGDFTCRCGFVYRRIIAADGSVGPPHCRQFGPLFGDAFKQAVSQSRDIRQVAKSLRMGRRNMIREAHRLGIDVPWRAETERPFRNLPPTGPWHPSKPRVRNRGNSPMRRRRNWPALDADLAVKVGSAAELIRSAHPPTRVSLSEVERHLGLEHWIAIRRPRLPLTSARLEELCEEFAEFRNRRQNWQVAQARASPAPEALTASVSRKHKPRSTRPAAKQFSSILGRTSAMKS